MRPTAHHTIGPFFPRAFVTAADGDLTGGRGPNQIPGQRIEIAGTVTDGRGRPGINVIVELYQADAEGRFPREPELCGFRGFGRAWTDAQGGYRFHTIKPGAYRASASGEWIRPPHLTFRILGSGIMRPLVTEAYFEGEPLNATDRQLARVPIRLRPRLVLRSLASDPVGSYRFDIALQGKRETPFIEIANP